MAQPAVRAESMQVSAVVTEPAMVKVRAWPAGDASAIRESLWMSTATGTDPSNPVNVAKFRMPSGTGAPPAAWLWRIYVALRGTPPGAGLSAAYGSDGVTRNIPARPAAGDVVGFSFVTGSCTQVAHPSQPNRPILAAAHMASGNPAFIVHMGDTSYVDTWKEILQDTPAHTYTKFATGLRRHFCQPDLAGLYNRSTVRMVIDDHDSGPDDSYVSTVYPQARQAFSDIGAGTSFDNATYDVTRPGAPTYDTWSSGPAQFWLLDNRLWRDPPHTHPHQYLGAGYASQLGTTQQTWLLNGLAASSAPVKIVFSPRAFKQFYQAPEQQQFLDWITGFHSGTPRVGGKVIFLTGDMHAGAVWKLSATRPVYEMLCAPIYNITRHTLTQLLDWQVAWGYQTRFLNTIDGQPGQAMSCAWGKVDIGADTSVTLNLIRDDGALLHREYIPA